MKLIAKNQMDIDALKLDLAKDFKQYKVSNPALNKNMVLVKNGLSRVSINQKNEELKVTGGINIMNMWFFIPFVLATAFGLIGGGLVILIFWLITRKKSAKLEKEVGNHIKQKYELNQLNLA